MRDPVPSSLLELFSALPECIGLFLDRGMACFGCPIARFHDLGDACREYGLDETAFRAELQAIIAPSDRRSSPGDADQ